MRGLLTGVKGRYLLFKPKLHQHDELVEPEQVFLHKSQAGQELCDKYKSFKEQETPKIEKNKSSLPSFKELLETLPVENMSIPNQPINVVNLPHITNPINTQRGPIDINELLRQKEQLDKQIQVYLQTQSLGQLNEKVNTLENMMSNLKDLRDEIHKFVQLIANQGINIPKEIQSKLDALNLKPFAIEIRRRKHLSVEEKNKRVIETFRENNNTPLSIEDLIEKVNGCTVNQSHRSYLKKCENDGLLMSKKDGNKYMYSLKS